MNIYDYEADHGLDYDDAEAERKAQREEESIDRHIEQYGSKPRQTMSLDQASRIYLAQKHCWDVEPWPWPATDHDRLMMLHVPHHALNLTFEQWLEKNRIDTELERWR